MVIGDLDAIGVAVTPSETDPPLIVDSNAVLPSTIAFQAFQPVSGRYPEIIEVPGIVQHSQLTTTDALNLHRESARDHPPPDLFRLTIRESGNHLQTITLYVI